MNDKVDFKDVMENSKKYKGCPLCFGKGLLGGIYSYSNQFKVVGKVICPECKGLGLVLTSEYEEEEVIK